MRLALTLFAGLLACGNAAVAEPPKTTHERPPQPASLERRPLAIVLASVDVLRAPGANGARPAPVVAKRKVAPRVTTCRCGDSQPETGSEEQ
jgi:hypothetical protein